MFEVDKILARLSVGAASHAAESPPAEDEATEHVETVEHSEENPHSTSRPTTHTVTVVNLFRHPDVHPLVLDLCLLKKYGPEFLLWEAETLELRIPQDFHTPEVSDLNMAKIQACRTLHLVDTYWQRWEVFCWVTASLNATFPNFDVLQVPTVSQCAISVDIASKIRDDVEWSSEVKTFIEQVLRFESVLCPVSPLDFVPLDTEGLVVDADDVRSKWPKVFLSRKAPTEESVTAEQLRRLLLIQEALDENRSLLRSQLPLVQHV